VDTLTVSETTVSSPDVFPYTTRPKRVGADYRHAA